MIDQSERAKIISLHSTDSFGHFTVSGNSIIIRGIMVAEAGEDESYDMLKGYQYKRQTRKHRTLQRLDSTMYKRRDWYKYRTGTNVGLVHISD